MIKVNYLENLSPDKFSESIYNRSSISYKGKHRNYTFIFCKETQTHKMVEGSFAN